MGLEALIQELEDDASTRITTASKKRIADNAAMIASYRVSTQNAYRLSRINAKLRRRREAGLHGYENMITQIQTATTQRIPSTGMHAYELLTNSRKHYTTRFEEMKEHLSAGMHYRDALQCLDHIQHDTYLKRRSRNDEGFAQHRNETIAQLQTYIRGCEKHHRPTTKLFKRARQALYAGMHAAWGAAVLYASMPF